MKPILMRMGCVGDAAAGRGNCLTGPGAGRTARRRFGRCCFWRWRSRRGRHGAGCARGAAGPGERPGNKKAPGCERGGQPGSKEHTPADPAGICGVPIQAERKRGSEHARPPAGRQLGGPVLQSKILPGNKKGPGRAGTRTRQRKWKLLSPLKIYHVRIKNTRGEAGRRCG